MAPELRFVVSMVRGDEIKVPVGRGGGLNRKPNAGFVMLDRAYCHRNAGEFSSERHLRDGKTPGGARLGVEGARALAQELADELNAKHGPL